MATNLSTTSQCKFFHVKLGSEGQPLLGTMQAFPYNRIEDPCTTAWLPPYQMEVPAGKTRCFLPNHQRFFYKKSRITGKVLPNSLFSAIGQVPRCDGQFDVLEYLIHN